MILSKLKKVFFSKTVRFGITRYYVLSGLFYVKKEPCNILVKFLVFPIYSGKVFRYLSCRSFFEFIEKSRKISGDSFLIVDNFEPSWLLGGFRVSEFNYLLSNVRNAYLLTFSKDIYKYSEWENFRDEIVWTDPVDFDLYHSNRRKYLKKFPFVKGKLLYMFNRSYRAKAGYVMFLYNAFLSYKFFEKNNIPFVFTLFPGGGFCLDTEFSDYMLKCVCSSPMLKGIYCPQKIVYKYMIQKQFVPKDKLFYRYGGGFFQMGKNDVVPKKFFRKDKDTFDIAFVAVRYMKKGLDKGFDLFLEVAKRIIPKYPFVHFHNVGTNGLFDFDEDFSSISSNFHNYGFVPGDILPKFYSTIDICLSMNRPNVLRKGAFDGFPLAVEACCCGSALFATNKLNEETEYMDGRDLVIVDTDVDEVVEKIEYYLEHLDELYEISRNGQLLTWKIFDIDKQKADRREFLQKYLDVDFL